MGRAESDECQVNMALMHQTCQEAGLPLEPSKTQGPCPILTFLGIELDTISMEMRLLQDKLRKTLDSLIQWRGRKACRKRDLLSLIGNLAHASKVVCHSRIFLRRLIDLSTTARLPMHFIRLSVAAKSDIEWWYQFIRQWNGTAMFPSPSAIPNKLPLMHQVIGVAGRSMRRDGSNSDGPTHSRIHIFP